MSATASATVDPKVIERLRESKSIHGDEMRRLGAQDGKAWAEEHAEAHELERLADRLADFRNDPSIDSKVDYLTWALCPADDVSAEMQFFKDVVSGDEATEHYAFSIDYLESFAEAACEVWHAVKGQL